MERIVIDTPLGQVWFWGEDRGQPILVVITGAFSPEYYLAGLHPHFPTLDVLRVHLPGNHCPPLSLMSVAAYAEAIDYALATAFPGRSVMVHGISIGGVVALAMRHPQTRRLAVVEPPLDTRAVWPLVSLYKATPPGWEAFVREIFGLEGKRLVGRDYRPLLDRLKVPTDVLLGAHPLMPPRAFDSSPSYVDEASRSLLYAHPSVTVTIAEGAGHNVPGKAIDAYAAWLDASVAAFVEALPLA